MNKERLINSFSRAFYCVTRTAAWIAAVLLIIYLFTVNVVFATVLTFLAALILLTLVFYFGEDDESTYSDSSGSNSGDDSTGLANYNYQSGNSTCFPNYRSGVDNQDGYEFTLESASSWTCDDDDFITLEGDDDEDDFITLEGDDEDDDGITLEGDGEAISMSKTKHV